MTEPAPKYVYKRTETGAERTPVSDADAHTLIKDMLLYPGEMMALPGKKHRTYRAPILLDDNHKPIRTPLTVIEGKKGA